MQYNRKSSRKAGGQVSATLKQLAQQADAFRASIDALANVAREGAPVPPERCVKLAQELNRIDIQLNDLGGSLEERGIGREATGRIFGGAINGIRDAIYSLDQAVEKGDGQYMTLLRASRTLQNVVTNLRGISGHPGVAKL